MYVRIYIICFPVLTITSNSNLEACENQRHKILIVACWHVVSAKVLINMNVVYSNIILEKSIY